MKLQFSLNEQVGSASASQNFSLSTPHFRGPIEALREKVHSAYQAQAELPNALAELGQALAASALQSNYNGNICY